MTLELKGSQAQKVCLVLGEAFSLQELRRIVRFKLDVNLDDVSVGGTRQEVIFELVEYAHRRKLVRKLIEVARAKNPENPELVDLIEMLGAGNVPVWEAAAIERVVNSRSYFNDVRQFRERLARLETWICWVNVPGGGGTCFLVGPDLVLPNYHVMMLVIKQAVSPADVWIIFDYIPNEAGDALVQETECPLAATWDLDHSPVSAGDLVPNGEPKPDELDYSHVCLDRKIGEVTIGGDPSAPLRDWRTVPSDPTAVVAADPLFLVQHPSVDHLQIAMGQVLSLAGNGTRIRHNASTRPGSSESPCFDANLTLVALHHSGDPDYDPHHKPDYNQAISIRYIVEQMKGNGVESFWDTVPN